MLQFIFRLLDIHILELFFRPGHTQFKFHMLLKGYTQFNIQLDSSQSHIFIWEPGLEQSQFHTQVRVFNTQRIQFWTHAKEQAKLKQVVGHIIKQVRHTVKQAKLVGHIIELTKQVGRIIKQARHIIEPKFKL